MFTYVKAKNFKSLKDIEFNLNRTKTKTNQFISIYGENGSGKTNIVELFKLLQQSTMSRATDIAMNKMPKEFWKIQEEMSDQLPTEIRQIFQLSLNLKEYRMIDEEEATEIEYGFKINNKEGFYYIKFDDEIIEEKLYYTAGKQRAYIFEIKKEDNKIIKNLKQQGYTIICITNLADEILLADRTLVLEQGKIALEIKREELVKKAEELRKYEIKLPTILEILVELQKNGIQVNAKDYTIPELVNYLVKAKAGGSK